MTAPLGPQPDLTRSIRVPEGTWNRFGAAASALGRSRSAQMRLLIEKFLRDLEQETEDDRRRADREMVAAARAGAQP
jgi:hypothetical protein